MSQLPPIDNTWRNLTQCTNFPIHIFVVGVVFNLYILPEQWRIRTAILTTILNAIRTVIRAAILATILNAIRTALGTAIFDFHLGTSKLQVSIINEFLTY